MPKQFGVNLDFAPVADVNSNPQNPIIGTRSFSSDPNKASELVAEAAEGVAEAVKEGILTEERIDRSVLKILETKYSSGIINSREKDE